MAFSGSVASMGLDEVLGFLAANNIEGTLSVSNPVGHGLTLYMHEGKVLFPLKRPPTPRPGSSGRLKRPGTPRAGDSGRLSRGTLDELLQKGAEVRRQNCGEVPCEELARERGKASGEAVLEEAVQSAPRPRAGGRGKSGQLSRKSMEEMLNRADDLAHKTKGGRHRQGLQSLLGMFEWKDARFRFEPGRLPPLLARALGGGDVLVLDANSLLMDVARRSDEGKIDSDPEHDLNSMHPVGLQGDLEGIGLAAVLQALRSHRRTGTLAVITSGREEHLYFKKGDVYALRGKEDSEFARFMLGDDVDDTMTRLAKAALDSPGLVKESDLTEGELRSLKDRFLDLLFWKGASFAFFPDNLPREFEADGKEGTRIALQSDTFLMEAIQRLTEWDHIRRSLGGREAVLRFVDPEWKLEAIREGHHTEILTLIDGQKGFEEVVRSSGLTHLEVGRVLARLREEGSLETVEDGSALEAR